MRKKANQIPFGIMNPHLAPHRRNLILRRRRLLDTTCRRPWTCLLAGMLALLAANSVSAQTFALPPAGEDLVGRIKVVGTRYQDTLSDVARAYDVGFDEIVRANPSA